MNPSEAYAKYAAAEVLLRDEYRKYWIERFAAAGIVMTPKYTCSMEGMFAGYTLDASSWPSHRQGVRVQIYRPSAPYVQQITVKSNSGFLKLIRRLQRQEFI